MSSYRLHLDAEFVDLSPESVPFPGYITAETNDALDQNRGFIGGAFDRAKQPSSEHPTIEEFKGWLTDYNRARSYRGIVIEAIGVTAMASASGDFFGLHGRSVPPHGLDTSAALAAMCGVPPSADERLPDWFLSDADVLTGGLHKTYNRMTTTALLITGNEAAAYAIYAHVIQNTAYARMRNILDRHGMPQETVDIIRQQNSLKDGTNVLLSKAKSIVGYEIPPRVMQHDNWLEFLNSLRCMPDEALSNDILNRADNAFAGSRLALGYYAAARYHGLEPDEAYQSLVRHGINFAAKEADGVSHMARFLMRSQGYPNIYSSYSLLCSNAVTDIESSTFDATDQRVIFPDEGRAGRCPAGRVSATKPEWWLKLFEKWGRFYADTYGSTPQIDNPSLASLYMLYLVAMLSTDYKTRIEKCERFYTDVQKSAAKY